MFYFLFSRKQKNPLDQQLLFRSCFPPPYLSTGGVVDSLLFREKAGKKLDVRHQAAERDSGQLKLPDLHPIKITQLYFFSFFSSPVSHRKVPSLLPQGRVYVALASLFKVELSIKPVLSKVTIMYIVMKHSDWFWLNLSLDQ